MKVEAVTFDCAQTLVAVDWRPAVMAVECASAVGLTFDEVAAASAYDRLLRSRWSEFQELNLSRDAELTDAFWHRLTVDWVAQCGFPPDSSEPLLAMAERRLFEPDSTVFKVFDDVVPCLSALKESGVRLAVVSNWDISLHKTLARFGLSSFFEVVVASMEEGVEKPDPKIFEVALARLDLRADQVVHVGDNPVDDLIGAKRAGMRGYVIDRDNPSDSAVYLSALTDLAGRLGV